MKILFVSIAFPPKNNPECLQAGKYFKYLSQIKGNAIEVLTSASPTLFMPYDSSLEKNIPVGTKMIELKIPENKYLNFIIRKIDSGFLQLPDSKFLFHRQWKKAIKKIEQKPDLIYSRSFPLSSTMMALKLVKYYKVPWVLHMSDPWVDNPLEHRTKKALKKNQQWEQESFSLASFISFTSEKTVNFYKRKYPQWSDKFLLMPNVYDPDDISKGEMEIDTSKPLHFVYTGGLTETRTPKPLFEAIKSVQIENADLLRHVKFSFAGQFDRSNSALFQEYNLPCVHNLGLLSYSDAMQLQKDAHVLMAIDSPAASEDQALFFPSKLLDYIASRKKVLAITDTNSTTYQVIQNKYGDCVAHNDIDRLKRLLKEYVECYRLNNSCFFSNKITDETYDARYNADRLNELFQQLK